MSKFGTQIVENIKKYGCHVMYVFGEGGSPGFSYSVGMEKTYGQPEIVVVGLRPEMSHAIINNMGKEYKEGKTYKSEHFYNDILENFDCLMLDVGFEQCLSQKNTSWFLIDFGLWKLGRWTCTRTG